MFLLLLRAAFGEPHRVPIGFKKLREKMIVVPLVDVPGELVNLEPGFPRGMKISFVCWLLKFLPQLRWPAKPLIFYLCPLSFIYARIRASAERLESHEQE